jgi:ABC-type lipoprotein export system ATPase subunit
MKDKIGFVPQNDYLLPNLTGNANSLQTRLYSLVINRSARDTSLCSVVALTRLDRPRYEGVDRHSDS